jgi:hypothetical protein
MYGQTVFTNAAGAGDGKWSTATNWTGGALPTLSAQLNASVFLDTNISWVGSSSTAGSNASVRTPAGVTVTLSTDAGVNAKKITLEANSTTISIGLLSSSPNFTFDAPIEFNGGTNPTGFIKSLQVNTGGTLPADYRQLTLGPNSVLTLNSVVRTIAQANTKVVFQGKINGAANLQFIGAAEFATTADNSNFNGDFVFVGNAVNIVSNTTVAGTFLKAGRKVQVNNPGCSLTLNGANSMNGNISVGGTNSFALNINANQGSFGTVIVNDGTLTINVDNSVTNLSFANSSALTWGVGTVAFTGFKDGVIRFGTDNTGLTSTQLSQITVDDGGNGLFLDSNGYLYSYDTTWTGVVDSAWSDAANWSNGVPTSGQDVYIPEVTIAPLISGSTNISLGDLIIDETDGLTINSGGVLIVNGTSTGNVTYKRNLGTTNWYLVSAPVNGEDMTDMRANNTFADGSGGGRIGFAPYLTSGNSWSYFTTSSTDALIAGIGYSAKLASAGDLSFTGTINTADVSVAVANTGTGFNLIGNPFTSHLNSATFLTDNSANLVSQTLWVWDGSTYDTKVTGESFVLAPGQGFFVRSSTGTNLNIAESYQATTGGTFQKSSNTEVKLIMNEGSNNRFAKMYYLNNATKGFDNGFDGETFGGIENTVDVFTNLVENNVGKKYQVQSLPISEMETMIIPVGVKAAAGKEITFTAEALYLPNDLKVFLEDRLTNTFTRLDEANTSYKVTLNDALNGTGRFFLHTKASGVLSTDDVALQNTSIYAINNNTLRVVGLPSGNANVKMYSILGKQVMSTSFSSTGVKDISLPKLSTGMYIIQLETATGKLNKKIVLE